jgi:hypothetical protein
LSFGTVLQADKKNALAAPASATALSDGDWVMNLPNSLRRWAVLVPAVRGLRAPLRIRPSAKPVWRRAAPKSAGERH